MDEFSYQQNVISINLIFKLFILLLINNIIKWKISMSKSMAAFMKEEVK